MSDSGSHRSALPAGYALHWYSVEKVLGRGGFGITYLASDNNLGQAVAIKEFLPTDLAYRTNDNTVQALSDEHIETYQWGLGRFLVEARTLARFRHPNIVLVHSVFEANNTAYIVMEYETGSSLEQAYATGAINTEAQLSSLLLSLMDGVECMHNEGFVHRDIKPSNIYLRDHNHPILLDFGSARQALGMETRTMTTMVSPGYAPFEQYNANRDNDSQGPWTDIYALGSTIYRGIAGKDPSDALSLANDRIKGLQEVVDPATRIGRGRYSDGFLHCIDVAMRFNANERPQSIGQWRDILLGRNQSSPEAVTVFSPPADVIAGMSPPQHGQGNQPATGQFHNTHPANQPGAQHHWPSPATGPAINTNPDQGHHNRTHPGFSQTGPSDTGQIQAGTLNTGPPNTGNVYPDNSQIPQANPTAGYNIPAATGHAVLTQPVSEVAPKKKGVLLPILLATTAIALAGIFFLLGRDRGVNNSTNTPASANNTVTQTQVTEEKITAAPTTKPRNTISELKTLSDVDCAALTVGTDGTVSGYATQAAISGIQTAAEKLVATPAADFSTTQIFPAIFCAPINAIGPYSSMVDSSVKINTTLPGDKLVEGNRLVLEMQSGSYTNNNFYVDYFSLDGNVVHLLSNGSEQTNKAKQDETLVLGEAGGIERWDITEPFGQEIISLVVSDTPLEISDRPEIEPAKDYLEALSNAISAGGVRASSSLLKINTQAAP